jgi:hypothetical protein
LQSGFEAKNALLRLRITQFYLPFFDKFEVLPWSDPMPLTSGFFEHAEGRGGIPGDEFQRL